jgi:GDP-L-fucose synthase
MNILILGGEGLVGSSFDYGTKVGRKDADLLKYEEVDKLIREHNPEWVINCAGKVGGVKANIENKFDFFEKNTIININVIKACMENNVPNLISFMSTCIFPDELAQKGRLHESILHYGEPHQSNYPYAYSKRMVDVMSRIAREKGFNYQCLIPTNLYGFNDNYDLNSSHLIPALIRKVTDAIFGAIIDNKLDEIKFEVWGTGTPIREFLFANDIPKIVKYIIDEDLMNFENMIISSVNSYSIADIVGMICLCFYELIGEKINLVPVFNSEMPDGQFAKLTDTSKFQILVPIELTPIKEGLKETIKFYLKKVISENNSRIQIPISLPYYDEFYTNTKD